MWLTASVDLSWNYPDVKQAVSDSLAESISIQSYYSMRKVADMYGLDAVCLNCKAFFRENFMELSDLSQFGCAEKNDILSVMKSEKPELSEEDKLMVLLKWVEKNPQNNQSLRDCLELLSFDEMQSSFLKNLLETHPITSNDFELYKLINGHLMKATVKTNKDGDELILLFDTNTDCIRSLNPMTEKVKKFHDEKFMHLNNFVPICLAKYIYALCENKSVHRLNFRSKNSKWEKMKEMIFDHGVRPSSVDLSGSIFVIGGSGVQHNAFVERFDPSVNQWFRLKCLPKAIRSTRLVTLNDSIYCIGGLGQNYKPVSSFSRFTPSLSEWVDLQPMRYPVYVNGVAAVDQKIFVVGGWVGSKYHNNVECYDVTSAQWTSLLSMNGIYGVTIAYHVGKWIFSVGRGENSHAIEKYDVLHNKWNKVELELPMNFCLYQSAIVKL